MAPKNSSENLPNKFKGLQLTFQVVYYYSWDRLKGGRKKALHVDVGVLLNLMGTAIMLISSAWASFMMSPVGFDKAGHFVGTTFQAVWNPLNIHRLLGNVVFGGLVAVAQAWAPYMAGDAEAGKALFFDPQGDIPCAKCHKVGEQGGEVRPELTNVAGTRTPQFIVESILQPSATIASGYESYLVITKEGRYITGVKKREDATTLELKDNNGETLVLAKANLKEIHPEALSLMPGNISEIITVNDFHNVLAFLMTLP